ncbi:MAG: lysophospholipid acyltransferase family protein [Beijerinckiaceae bacterium]|nr:lysophospholipid acyltransferase family protein [Beijerinckiaceae bacterium]MCZ8301501.1 lysophospholipid acyltransferase family protein [Beijerinckiaceae bacterium]
MNAPNRFLPKVIALAVTGFARLVTGVRPEWRGCEPAPRRRVYFANHASHGDFVLIWTVLPAALRARTRPVAAGDYWGGDGLRGYIGRAVFNAALIDRTPEPGQQHPIDYLRGVLAEGSSLIFFPEGTRNTTDAVLLPFKSGLFRLAEGDSETEFVPVWIDNLSRVMPKGQFLPIPLLCSVTFGAPMHHEPGEEKTAFLNRAREALLALKPKGPAA